MAAKVLESIGKVGLAVALAGGVVNSALYNVDAGHRAVIFDRFRGVQDTVVGEGTHFLIPWVQKPIIFDCRSRPRNVPVTTGSKDLQNVHITLRILFRPAAGQLPRIFASLGEAYDERVLPSVTTEVLKAAVARFDAEELITQRALVSRQVSEDLAERAGAFGLILDDVSLTHLTFGKEFTEAIEAKQVAQQEAEMARFVVEKAEQQKKAAIISAEGDAKAAELIANSLAAAGDGLIELRKLEAAEDIAYQLSGSRNVTYLPLPGRLLPARPGVRAPPASPARPAQPAPAGPRPQPAPAAEVGAPPACPARPAQPAPAGPRPQPAPAAEVGAAPACPARPAQPAPAGPRPQPAPAAEVGAAPACPARPAQPAPAGPTPPP